MLELAYGSPLALLRDLRAAGEGNAVTLRDRRTPPRELFARAAHSLSDALPHPTALRLAMLTGWSPSPDQPKPLRPGQFTIPLAEALEDRTDALLGRSDPA